MVVNSPGSKPGDYGGLLLPRTFGNLTLNHSLSFKEWEIEDNKLEVSVMVDVPSLGYEQPNSDVDGQDYLMPVLRHPKHLDRLLSPRSVSELEEAAIKLQKSYKSYRTRRNLADCAVIVEELWWKAIDFATLRGSSVSFFHNKKHEPVASRWARAGRRAAKVGKGLSKNEKAQKLAIRHWLEAIDPRHRYGHNLHIYYEAWHHSESDQPFFYWLDVGDGKELNLEKCPRDQLQQQSIKYLGPNEREAYEVIVRGGKLVHKKSGVPVDTTAGSKWIFVLSTSRKLYVGKKQKGKFQHSSFLAGGATTAAGRLVVQDGVLMAIWPYSGHYLPTEENFNEFKSFLKESNVDLSNVKIGTSDDEEDLSFARPDDKDRIMHNFTECRDSHGGAEVARTELDNASTYSSQLKGHDILVAEKLASATFELSMPPSCRWTTGAGARIGCVRDYPQNLQVMALEVSLSPRPALTPQGNKIPIPSPRPSPQLRCSPSISCMGIPSPRLSPRLAQMVFPTPTVSLKLPPLKRRDPVLYSPCQAV